MKPETIQLLKNLAWGVGLLSLVSLLLYGAWHLVRMPSLTIENIIVTGGETINHAALQQVVEEELDGMYWQFIPYRFAFTYPRAAILAAISETPRVKDPVVERRGRTVQVTLAEFEPVALWCDSGIATGTACVFLDENGYGFAEAPILDGGAFLRFERVGEEASIRSVYTDTQDFAWLRTLVALLDDYGWPVERIELDQARDAFVFLVGDSELKVTLTMTPQETLDNLQAVLSDDTYAEFTPGSFVYIDLRFGNKVFVSEFGPPVDVPEVDSATSTATSTAATATTTEIAASE